jgi:hypothetical protein
MRRILGWICVLALGALCSGAQGGAPAKKSTASTKKAASAPAKAPAAGKKTVSAPAKAPAAGKKTVSAPAKAPAAGKKTASAPAKAPAAGKKAAYTPAKAAASKGGAAKKASSAKRGKKSAPKVTWRNRQTAPTEERYKEIQEALAAKGYLQPEDANGTWGPGSADALKKFQAEQNIEATGKIDSLSLIALGLGPKRDATPAPKPPDPSPAK